ncbi:hypothetical protein PVA38_11370 [Streptococcus pneumoniae D39]|nr:hypothetical protein PVA38_11370 [Streptococcus pneumoniae D39]
METIANTCLLYTSDAADEARSVDLGGRRIIKKKKKPEKMCGCDHKYNKQQNSCSNVNDTSLSVNTLYAYVELQENV